MNLTAHVLTNMIELLFLIYGDCAKFMMTVKRRFQCQAYQYLTDQKLKSFLDTNQLARERLCAAVLSLDGRFINVQLQHPRGGPDGSKDIIAKDKHEQIVHAAVGFANQATDTEEHRKKVDKKFRDDFYKIINKNDKPKIFVFFTNVNLTISKKNELVKFATDKGMFLCDIFDRERIRAILDSPDGFSARYQYLQITLSEAEQATFFARIFICIVDIIYTVQSENNQF